MSFVSNTTVVSPSDSAENPSLFFTEIKRSSSVSSTSFPWMLNTALLKFLTAETISLAFSWSCILINPSNGPYLGPTVLSCGFTS